MLTAWNWVAFQGSRVFGSEVIPMTRLPPGAPAAPVVSDGVGVPVHAATRARAAAPTVTPTRVRTRRTGERCGDMRALLGQGALPQKYPVRGRNVTSCRSLPPSRGVVSGARVRFR